ncbi:MAG: hotdog fold thioesterase [Pseudomonadales bacterium]|jgi:1,4-dihydroxy-2-naphthoyl-CoA hydrolase|nr:hotdog fold thioesterase [Pseudomonadales bacterium]
MSIWKRDITLSEANRLMAGTMCEHLGMALTEIGADYLVGRLPVDERTRQYMGIIHGGASVVLAETLGSIGALLCCPPGLHVVGLDINANHLRAGHPPYVIGTARPLHLGASTMVWDIRITDAEGKLVCVSRLTCAVLEDR